MKISDNGNTDAIIKSYHENFQKVLQFIVSRINCVEDAENLTQDVWVRLLTYTKPISPETLTSMIFVIARNLINDYLRYMYRSLAFADEWICNNNYGIEPSPEYLISARDLAKFEKNRVECLPPQRRTIYIMCRHGEKTTDEIARNLSLSKRTVENHLRLGRHEIRNYMAACI